MTRNLAIGVMSDDDGGSMVEELDRAMKRQMSARGERPSGAAVAEVLGEHRQNWHEYTHGIRNPSMDKLQGWLRAWEASGRGIIEVAITGKAFRISVVQS